MSLWTIQWLHHPCWDQVVHRIPVLWLRAFALFMGILLLASLLIYGITVIIENHIVDISLKTRDLHEDNQDLQIQLDRLRAYQKVGAVSESVHQLNLPETTIDVMEKGRFAPRAKDAPVRRIPKEVYGY